MNEGKHYHETVAEMLDAWDDGETIWTVEMGGMGPGYEQAIAIGVVELCRKCQDMVIITIDDNEAAQYTEGFKKALHEVNDEHNLGLSSAQAGAIKQVASRFLTDGPRKALLTVEEQCPGEDRVIMVDKRWPGRAA